MMLRVNPSTDRPHRDANAVEGKRLILGLLLALVLAVGLVFYFGVTGGSTHVPLSKAGVGFTTDPAPTNRATDADAGQGRIDGGPPHEDRR